MRHNCGRIDYAILKFARQISAVHLVARPGTKAMQEDWVNVLANHGWHWGNPIGLLLLECINIDDSPAGLERAV